MPATAIKQNTLLVFLHGFGFDKTNNHEELEYLALSLGLNDYVSFDAPFPSKRERGGFAWFDIEKDTRKWLLDDGKFKSSIVYIYEKIEKELVQRHMTRESVILCGRSQGACMAIYIGLTSPKKCKAIVSLCGLFHSDLTYKIVHTIPVIRLEAGKDTMLSEDRKNSYKRLQADGIQVNYLVDETSDHDHISPQGMQKVAHILKNI